MKNRHKLSPKQEDYAKSLRQRIMITVKQEHGWAREDFYSMLNDWGYGDSLRKLSIYQLQTVLGIVKGEYEPNNQKERKRQLDKYSIGYLDNQGRYAWHLMKLIGWDWFRVQKYMVKKYHTLHWNALKEEEKRGMIAMLKSYLKKEDEDFNTKSTKRRHKGTKEEEELTVKKTKGNKE